MKFSITTNVKFVTTRKKISRENNLRPPLKTSDFRELDFNFSMMNRIELELSKDDLEYSRAWERRQYLIEKNKEIITFVVPSLLKDIFDIFDERIYDDLTEKEIELYKKEKDLLRSMMIAGELFLRIVENLN